MANQSQRRRRSLTGLMAVVVAAGAASSAFAAPAFADPASPDPTGAKAAPKSARADKLGSHDHDLLAKAKAKGDKTVTVIVMADKKKSKNVVSDITKLGGKVVKQADKIGYVHAVVPTDKVERTAKLSGVLAVDLNESIPMPDPKPEHAGAPAAKSAATLPGPGADTPATNPYMPTSEIGAVAFKKAHPTWDGRGVTIGILDSGVDLDHPALQTTTTGERKIVDWFTATDPLTDSDGTWRAMITSVTGPTFTYAGQTWTTPAGSYKINQFSEAITAVDAEGSYGGDVNRDGDTTDKFGVLYDPVSHNIWVDANGDHDFTNDGGPMRPYKEKFQVGHFGTDNPATALREQVPFVVEYRQNVDLSPAGVSGVADFVNIGILESDHGTHVAGIAAGNDLLGNAALDGGAPGAKIVSARACNWTGGCTAVALSDGMVELVTNRHVDVVNMSIGGLPALNDGNNARARLYDRLISDYGVQLVISAGNSGPGVNTIGDPAVANNVIAVAASISKETWLSNYGSATTVPYQLFDFSSRGPREDGGFKPNIAAPGSAISSTPEWEPGSPVAEAGYQLPPGYSMFNGTSMASPQAAGGVALLLSAAKANDKGVTPAALRRAVYTSAKWIDGAAAAGQGNGQLDVPGAWDLLKGSLVETRDYTSSAPVCTSISGFLATPNVGTGIYNRCTADAGGVKVGQSTTYKVQITRTSGPDKSVKHNLEWVGNDGTFSSDKSVNLPLNKTVTVNVKVKAASEGAHSAVLRIDDPKTAVVDFETMHAVLVANTPAQPGFGFATSGVVDRNNFKSYFVTVPAGAKALQVNLSGIATGSQTRFIAINPYGVPVESTSSLQCYTNYSDASVCKPQERSYENPMAGIWEIEVESRRTTPAMQNPYQLTARIQGVAVTPATVTLPTVTAGKATPVSWTVANQYGPVTISGKGGALGSSLASRPTIADQAVQTYTIEVPAGASRLDVAIGNPSDAGADLDLFVRFNGAVVAQSADGDAEESVSIANPTPGTYTVEVDGYSVPAGTTAYDYRDVFYSPALGQLTAPTTTKSLPYGASTTISGSVTVQAAPAAGRQLFGELLVVTDEGAVIGRGNVSVGAVTTG